MPIPLWPQYADHPLAPKCRSRTGSNMPVGDKAGIKYGKMSLMQIREALIAGKPTKWRDAAKGKNQARPGSKMEAAIKIVADNPNLPRKAIIARFIDDAGLTKAGANTYYQLVHKKIGSSGLSVGES